jgi:hypothetical protein
MRQELAEGRAKAAAAAALTAAAETPGATSGGVEEESEGSGAPATPQHSSAPGKQGSAALLRKGTLSPTAGETGSARKPQQRLSAAGPGASTRDMMSGVTPGAATGLVTVDSRTGRVVAASETAASLLLGDGTKASAVVGKELSECGLPSLTALAEAAAGKFPPLCCALTRNVLLEATVRPVESSSDRRQLEVTLHNPAAVGDTDTADMSVTAGIAATRRDRGIVLRVLGTLFLAAAVIVGNLAVVYSSFTSASSFTVEINQAARCRFLLTGTATFAREVVVGDSALGTHAELVNKLLYYSSELQDVRHKVCSAACCACGGGGGGGSPTMFRLSLWLRGH